MAQPSLQPSRRIYRFGVFEFDADNRELRKRGVRIQLQPKPLAMLELLIERPNEVISRDEVRRRLWGDDTFVDFESGLNTTVNRLRLRLADSAEAPRYVETIARTGYRFVAPVEKVLPPEEAPTADLAPVPLSTTTPRNYRGWGFGGILGLILSGVTALVLWMSTKPRPLEQPAEFRQLTFRHGKVLGARFAPGHDEIIYSSQWDGEPRQLYVTDSASAESRAVGFADMTLQSVSPTRELLLLSAGGTMNIGGGNLFRVPLNGSAPTPVEQGVMSAEWAPDGKTIALIRAKGGKNQVEFPPGKVLYSTSGWVSSLRFLASGTGLAFVEHPVRHDDAGFVRILDKSVRSVGGNWASVTGLAWDAESSEIWISASRAEGPRSLWALSPSSGSARAIEHAPGSLTIKDVAAGHRALVVREERSLEMAGRLRGQSSERDLSWLDWSRVQEISPDGSAILFDESGEARGPGITSFVRFASEPSARHVGTGMAMAFSSDARSVLLASADRRHLRLVEIATGTERPLKDSGLFYQWAKIFRAGSQERLLVLGSVPDVRDKGLRMYIQDPLSGKTWPIGPEMMIRNAAISTDGAHVAVLSPDRRLLLFSTTGDGSTPPREIPTEEPLAPVRWSSDSRTLFVQRYRSYTDIPAQIFRLDAASSKLTPWKTISPANLSGVDSITGVVLSSDEQSYVYSYRRALGSLYLQQPVTSSTK